MPMLASPVQPPTPTYQLSSVGAAAPSRRRHRDRPLRRGHSRRTAGTTPPVRGSCETRRTALRRPALARRLHPGSRPRSARPALGEPSAATGSVLGSPMFADQFTSRAPSTDGSSVSCSYTITGGGNTESADVILEAHPLFDRQRHQPADERTSGADGVPERHLDGARVVRVHRRRRAPGGHPLGRLDPDHLLGVPALARAAARRSVGAPRSPRGGRGAPRVRR